MKSVADIEVIRDCLFQYVGKIPTRLENRLVFCGTVSHIAEALRHDGIAGIITREELIESIPDFLGVAIAKNPLKESYRIHEHLCAVPDYYWMSEPTLIDASVVIGAGAVIAPNNVSIGAGTIIHPGAIIGERTIIGTNCSIGPGVVLACDAFEVFKRDEEVSILRQAGGVRIGNFVDIQAKSTIVRSTFGGFTEIGDETKIDCQVHVAHDCSIGKRVRIAACAEISGRVEIGDDVYLGPNCSISNGLSLGDGSFVTIGSVVVKDVPCGQRVTGNFAVAHQRWIRFVKSVANVGAR